MKYDDELILKAAWYYYIENMTQQAIASKLEISRMKVIRLLDVARETGVIQFRISPDLGKQDVYKRQGVYTVNYSVQTVILQ